MSTPAPTNGTPHASPRTPIASRPVPAAFAWPTPPYAAYPPAHDPVGPEACEIVGNNGRLLRGRLIHFAPDEQIAHVHLPPARSIVPLRFDQFRALVLEAPLSAAPVDGGGPGAQVLRERPRTAWSVQWRDGTAHTGESVGHVRHDFGVFLFDPLDEAGAVRRRFIPSAACSQFEFGARIGELLVESQATTPAVVEHAAQLQRSMRDQKVGDILLSEQAVTPTQLDQALVRQSRMPMVRIGEALLGMGLIRPEHLEAALERQKADRSVPLGELLVRLGLVSQRDLQTALARKMGYPVVDVRHFPIETEALRKVPAQVAGRLQAVPLMVRNGGLVVAIADPCRRNILDELEFVAQCKVVPVLAQGEDLYGVVHTAYARIGSDVRNERRDATPADAFEFVPVDTGTLVATLERDREQVGTQEEDRPIEQSDNSLVRLINQTIIDAQASGASDIHIESDPGREKVRIRFRKDGRLQPYLELPHNYRAAVIARVKIMCDLDISERRKPQDGKINFSRHSPQHRLELRVATIPTHHGQEDVVMRLLSSAAPMALDRLGLSQANLGALRAAVERPYGLVLCVGPTGSGKTTTLHAALAHINRPERKIWTAEDPVEITQPGLRQVQVNPKIDWTFAMALRAFLRADPDVVMVGEMRDAETAHAAVEAALTGHLVMSTLHTNSAVDTVTRLLDMGMDPFNFSDSLLAVLAQRLVRRICPACRTTRAATPAELDALLNDWMQSYPAGATRPTYEEILDEWQREHAPSGGGLFLHEAAGCPACHGSGFDGRVAVHELMVATRELRALIQAGRRGDALLRTALCGGMRTLRQDGISKVLAGQTTIEEVRASCNV